jgi:hypothetical protein
VEIKLGEQRRFVLWWDQQEKDRGGGDVRNTANRPVIGVRPEDFGLDRDTIHRWRKRLAEAGLDRGGVGAQLAGSDAGGEVGTVAVETREGVFSRGPVRKPLTFVMGFLTPASTFAGFRRCRQGQSSSRNALNLYDLPKV